jgi:hypothetical protein
LTTKTTGGDIDISSQLIASGDNYNTTGNNSLKENIISAASSGNLNITSPELNIAGTLVSVNIPGLDIDRMGKDPCASSRENSLKSLGHGGVPAFQNGENYLPVNRFNQSEKEFLGTPKIIASADHSHHKNISVECSKTQMDLS